MLLFIVFQVHGGGSNTRHLLSKCWLESFRMMVIAAMNWALSICQALFSVLNTFCHLLLTMVWGDNYFAYLHFIDEETRWERLSTLLGVAKHQSQILNPGPLEIFYEDELPLPYWLVVHHFKSLKEEIKLLVIQEMASLSITHIS